MRTRREPDAFRVVTSAQPPAAAPSPTPTGTASAAPPPSAAITITPPAISATPPATPRTPLGACASATTNVAPRISSAKPSAVMPTPPLRPYAAEPQARRDQLVRDAAGQRLRVALRSIPGARRRASRRPRPEPARPGPEHHDAAGGVRRQVGERGRDRAHAARVHARLH